MSTTSLARARRARRRDERGAMLVELMIVMVLGVGILGIATALFIAGLRGNEQVTSTTEATMQAQGAAQGVERAVRNARRIKLEGCASPNTSCSKITVWTTLGGQANCQVWQLSSAAPARIEYAGGAISPGAASAYGSGAPGATLTFPSAVLDLDGKVIGVTYAVTYRLSATMPVQVTGTVRSRTPYDTTSATTCGIAA